MGTSPTAPRRNVSEPLDSYGSHQANTSVIPAHQYANRRGHRPTIFSSNRMAQILCLRKYFVLDQILAAGLQSDYVTVNDSDVRHQGKNGFVTHIGNDFL